MYAVLDFRIYDKIFQPALTFIQFLSHLPLLWIVIFLAMLCSLYYFWPWWYWKWILITKNGELLSNINIMHTSFRNSFWRIFVKPKSLSRLFGYCSNQLPSASVYHRFLAKTGSSRNWMPVLVFLCSVQHPSYSRLRHQHLSARGIWEGRALVLYFNTVHFYGCSLLSHKRAVAFLES